MEQTVQNWLQQTSKELQSLGLDMDSAWQESLLLLSHISGRKKTWLIAHQKKTLLQQTENRLKQALHRRLQHEPIAYILGTQPFCGHSIYTDKRALIPRPETEEMTFYAIKRIRHIQDKIVVWDVGTGSGAIAVSIALAYPHIPVIASDISRTALKLAEKNAQSSKVTNVRFTRSNLLGRNASREIQASGMKHLFIISNLPYLPPSDKKNLMRDVLAFEPWSALFAKKQGLSLNQQLLAQLANEAKKKSFTRMSLLMEFDPPQAKTLKNQAQKPFPKAKIRIKKDSCERDRFLELTLDFANGPERLRSS